METGNFIAQLREIRSSLQEAVRLADNFEYKLLGPRPSGEATLGQAKQPSESVSSLLADISSLSVRLPKMLDHQHEIVGEFAPKDAGAPATPARYA